MNNSTAIVAVVAVLIIGIGLFFWFSMGKQEQPLDTTGGQSVEIDYSDLGPDTPEQSAQDIDVDIDLDGVTTTPSNNATTTN